MMATKGSRLRALAAWMAWAKSSLPVPLSPLMRMAAELAAIFFARALAVRMAGL